MKNLKKFNGSFEELIDLLKEKDFEKYGSITYQNGILLLETGGWSDNEKMLYQLSLSLFQYFYWVANWRGGKVVYSADNQDLTKNLYETIVSKMNCCQDAETIEKELPV